MPACELMRSSRNSQPGAGLPLKAFACLMVGIFASGCANNTPSQPTVAGFSRRTPNGQIDLPPIHPATAADLTTWFQACGWPWTEQQLSHDTRRMRCIDLTPYSGQPGHHVFIYQEVLGRPFLLFAAVVWDPPQPGVSFSFALKEGDSSLEIRCGGVYLFSVDLSRLWCD